VSIWKKIAAIAPADDGTANLIVDSPGLVVRVGASLGTYIDVKGKLQFDTSKNFGVDGYQYYIGLIKELNRIIYGEPTDTINYPGIRAAGTAIGIKEAIVKRIKSSMSIRIKSGVPFSEIRERVKSSVAGYVNTLGVGESVSISRMIAAANIVPGVVSVAVTYPVFDSSNDLIPVSNTEKAFVVDPASDITISLIG
jgi:hypothetical protein